MSSDRWRLTQVRDRAEIEAFLRRDPVRHLYELGDLVDPYWDRCSWLAAMDGPEIQSLALLFGIAPDLMLHAMGAGTAADQWLIAKLIPQLPLGLYAHVTKQLLSTELGLRASSPPTRLIRMTLANTENLKVAPPPGMVVRALSTNDLPDLNAFYDDVYGEHTFVNEMLIQGLYVGAFVGESLAGVAGTHLLSKESDVAALGNIATSPSKQGQGVATCLISTLCLSLLTEVSHIGLDVRADNQTAIRLYDRLGFRTALEFYGLKT